MTPSLTSFLLSRRSSDAFAPLSPLHLPAQNVPVAREKVDDFVDDGELGDTHIVGLDVAQVAHVTVIDVVGLRAVGAL